MVSTMLKIYRGYDNNTDTDKFIHPDKLILLNYFIKFSGRLNLHTLFSRRFKLQPS